MILLTSLHLVEPNPIWSGPNFIMVTLTEQLIFPTLMTRQPMKIMTWNFQDMIVGFFRLFGGSHLTWSNLTSPQNNQRAVHRAPSEQFPINSQYGVQTA